MVQYFLLLYHLSSAYLRTQPYTVHFRKFTVSETCYHVPVVTLPIYNVSTMQTSDYVPSYFLILRRATQPYRQWSYASMLHAIVESHGIELFRFQLGGKTLYFLHHDSSFVGNTITGPDFCQGSESNALWRFLFDYFQFSPILSLVSIFKEKHCLLIASFLKYFSVQDAVQCLNEIQAFYRLTFLVFPGMFLRLRLSKLLHQIFVLFQVFADVPHSIKNKGLWGNVLNTQTPNMHYTFTG